MTNGAPFWKKASYFVLTDSNDSYGVIVHKISSNHIFINHVSSDIIKSWENGKWCSIMQERITNGAPHP